MTADKHFPNERGVEEKTARSGDKAPADAVITNKSDSETQQRLQTRDALKAHRLTKDKSNAFEIDMGDGRVIEDARGFKNQGQEQAKTRDTDYTPQRVSDHSFALGVNRQETPDTRTPGEKLQEFLQAAAKRAADPEGWKAWAQGEINKFSGIGAGLNEAKEETKAAVAASWKALTDGTVMEFLSQPNAINAPVFKIVENAFEAMGKDPEAVNKAFERLGKVIMKASEGYSNLPDYEKGKVIGKVMFGMVNPEGSTADGETALKIADQVATHVDKAVMQTIEQSLKATEEAAKTSPELAQQTKQMLFDYLKNKGVSVSELEKAGEIPKGYFESLSGRGGDWPVLNEHPSPDVVVQTEKYSCVSACGEMLTDGKFSQAELIEKLGAPADTKRLAEILGPPWKGSSVTEESLDGLLNGKRPWAAELRELQSTARPGRLEPAHTVVVDGLALDGNIMIRDPADGTRYEMTRANFIKHWNLTALYQ